MSTTENISHLFKWGKTHDKCFRFWYGLFHPSKGMIIKHLKPLFYKVRPENTDLALSYINLLFKILNFNNKIRGIHLPHAKLWFLARHWLYFFPVFWLMSSSSYKYVFDFKMLWLRASLKTHCFSRNTNQMQKYLYTVYVIESDKACFIYFELSLSYCLYYSYESIRTNRPNHR